MEQILVYYFLLINIVLFVLMGIDKGRAKRNKYRIREMTLFVLGVLGGFLGGFAGMLIFRHKTRKVAFYAVYGLSFCLYSGVLIFAGSFFYI